MQLRIACIFPFTDGKQEEIMMGLEHFLKRHVVTHESAPGRLKIEMKLETKNEADGILLALSDALRNANGGQKFDPPVQLEPEIAMDPILI